MGDADEYTGLALHLVLRALRGVSDTVVLTTRGVLQPSR
jgi:hypothetical protein